MSSSNTEPHHFRRRWLLRLGRVLVAARFAARPTLGQAASQEHREVVIVVSDEGDLTRKVVADLRRRLPRAEVGDIKVLTPRRALVIAVGPAALRSVMAASVDGPVISIFTSSQVYHSILETATGRRPASTAIYAEPSPTAQLRLVRLLFKRPIRTTVVLGGRTTFLESLLQRAAAEARIPLTVENYELDDSISRILGRSGESHAILAIPDSLVFTSDNLRTVLLTTYRNGQAVIGFSAALVRAGALATTFSEVEDINAQLEELVSAYEGSGQLPAPQFPKYFRTLINEDVARSLNVVIDDAVRAFANRPEKR
jgi:hypothetical protein